MKKYNITKEFVGDGLFLDATDGLKEKRITYNLKAVVIADVDEERPMAWIRIKNKVNAIVYLDSYNQMFGKGSSAYENEIREILRELKLYHVDFGAVFRVGDEEVEDNVLEFRDR